MSTQENYIVILLRKILALAAPHYFDATEDTYRDILLEKISETDIFLYDVIRDFLSLLNNNDRTYKDGNNNDIIQETNNSSDIEFKNSISILEKECKSLHINIDYELEQLLNNGNIIEE